VKDRQPRLYDYALGNRDKRAVLAHLDPAAMKPVLHVSGMFGAARHNIALIVPLALHPVNRNEVICFDLDADPAALFELDAGELSERLFSRTEELPEGELRPGIKTVHANRCPLLMTAKMADPTTAERLGISGERCRTGLAALREYRARHPNRLEEKLRAIYTGRGHEPESDPDRMLYSGGFFSDADRRVMERVRACTPEALAQENFPFEDPRLPEMLFRYRARNHPDSLTAEERTRWEEYRVRRLTEPGAGASTCLGDYRREISELLESGELSPVQEALMRELRDYGESLLV